MTGPQLKTDQMSEVWTALTRAGDAGLPVTEIEEQVDVSLKGVYLILEDFERQGFAVRIERPGRAFWRAVQSKAPIFGPADYRLWQTARAFGTFSATDLAAHASVEGDGIPVPEAQRFCRLLLGAGYLKVKRKAKPGYHDARYQLIRNTGPKAPHKRRVTVLVDPNTGEVHLPEGLA